MTRRPSPQQQVAVSRRLALLSAELAASRSEDAEPSWVDGHTRIRPGPAPEPPPRPESVEPDPPPLVQVPGRHASRRRSGRSFADVVPATLRGRVALGPAQLTVVAVIVAVGLAVTCWWVVRGDPDRLEAPVVTTPSSAVGSDTPLASAPLAGASPVAATATGSAPGSSSGAVTDAATRSDDETTVTVDVAGKVRRPGIAVLDAGSRVVDALKAAGGVRRGVDASDLNLARVLVDGEQIVVGAPAPPGVSSSAMTTAGAPGGPLVNLNSASQGELEALPEVGPVTAQAILSWRQEHGGFTAVDELLEVDGIGDATLGQIAPYVTV